MLTFCGVELLTPQDIANHPTTHYRLFTTTCLHLQLQSILEGRLLCYARAAIEVALYRDMYPHTQPPTTLAHATMLPNCTREVKKHIYICV